MFKEGTLIQLKNGKHLPYRMHIAIGYAEFGDAMPQEEQHEGFNVYGFYDEHGRLKAVCEHEIEAWTPHDDTEAWLSQFGPRTWIEYQWCVNVARWFDGIPEDLLMRRLAERESAL